MATRLYLPATAEVTAISPTASASWEDTTILARVVARTSKRNNTLTSVSFSDANAANRDVLFRQYVSLELDAGQTITGGQNLKAQALCSETDAGNAMFLAIGIRVIANDGSTVRKVVLDVFRDAVEIRDDAAGGLQNRQFATTSAVTNYTTLAGDRLVIEVGTGGDPAGGKSHSSTIRLGDSSGTDLAEDDTTTTDNNPWIEFTDTLTFIERYGLYANETAALLQIRDYNSRIYGVATPYINLPIPEAGVPFDSRIDLSNTASLPSLIKQQQYQHLQRVNNITAICMDINNLLYDEFYRGTFHISMGAMS